MAASSIDLEDILTELMLHNVIEKFKSERIDLDNFLSLSEQQLTRLGISTIGDRLRLTDRVRSEINKRNIGLPINRNETSSLASQIVQQRNTLFNRKKSGRGRKRRYVGLSNSVDAHSSFDSSEIQRPRTRGSRTWTVTVLCLADKNAKKVPSVEERTVLMKAGLGAKKIQFDVDDEESDVMRKLESDDLRNEETIGFPQLKSCGGFELLNCKQNCRQLTLINCPWNIRSLKSYIGNQAKIYIRPIQSSLDTTPKDQGEVLSEAKESCKACHCLFPVRELRQHVQICVGGKSECDDELQALDSDDLPDLINPTQSFLPLQMTDQEAILNDVLSINREPFVAIPDDETQSQMATASTDRDSSTPMMKDDDSNLPSASETNGTGSLGGQFQNACVSTSRPIQALSALQQTATNSSPLEVTSAASCIETSNEGTICANAHEPELLSPESVSEEKQDQSIEPVIATAIEYCLSHNIQDPVEMLRYLQSVIVTGRNLEIEDTSQLLQGPTNFIIVDRENILETAFEEISCIADLRTTLEVQFYEEVIYLYILLIKKKLYLILCIDN